MHDTLSDRREHCRFEITGRMWAALEVDAVGGLQNLSIEGALVDAPREQIWSSIRTVAIVLRDGGVPITGIVTRIGPHPEDPQRLQMALQFVNPSLAAIADIEALIARWAE